MENKKFMSMDEIKNNFESHIKKEPVKNAGFTIIALAILILIWGVFHGIAKVKFPKDKIPVFPDKEYQTATNYFTPKNKYVFLGKEQIQELIVSEYNSNKLNRNSIDNIIKTLENEFQNKNIIFKTINESLGNSVIISKHKEITERCQSKIDSIFLIESNLSYYERRNANILRRRYVDTITHCGNLLLFTKELKIIPKVFFPFRNKYESFTYVAGPFIPFQKKESFIYELSSEGLKVIVDNNFFTKSDIPNTLIDKAILDKEEIIFNKIKNDDKKNFNQYRLNEKKRLKAQTKALRKNVRKSFYSRWYTTLFSALMTIFMIFVLLRYFSIIRRKGLPKKSTDKIYYATNTTSLVFRWIALIVVIGGLIHLGLDLISIVFKSKPLGILSFFPEFGFLYAFIAPIITVIIAVLASWFFVLEAEFICFLSNCYHVLFVKVHSDFKEQQNSDNRT